MILDELLEFADATALNGGGAGTYLVGDQIDLGTAPSPGPRAGVGGPLYLVIQSSTSFVSGGGGSVAFVLASDSTASIATDGSATEHFRTRAYTAAQGAAGAVLAIVRLPEHATYERYLGILQVVTTAAFSAGAINAFLTHDVSNWVAHDAPWQG